MPDISSWAQTLPAGLFYAVLFLWLFVESTGFPLSDEPLLLLAGYLAHVRALDLLAIITVALTGKVAASCLAYWAGQRISLARMARPPARPASGAGRWLHALRPTARAVALTEQRFRRSGAVWSVLAGRLVPVVRSFISYPAGAARMPFAAFLLATTMGSLLWIATWTILGAALGASYQVALARWGSLGWLALLALLIVVAGGLWWSNRRRRASSRPMRGGPLQRQRSEARD